METHETY